MNGFSKQVAGRETPKKDKVMINNCTQRSMVEAKTKAQRFDFVGLFHLSYYVLCVWESFYVRVR